MTSSLFSPPNSHPPPHHTVLCLLPHQFAPEPRISAKELMVLWASFLHTRHMERLPLPSHVTPRPRPGSELVQNRLVWKDDGGGGGRVRREKEKEKDCFSGSPMILLVKDGRAEGRQTHRALRERVKMSRSPLTSSWSCSAPRPLSHALCIKTKMLILSPRLSAS